MTEVSAVVGTTGAGIVLAKPVVQAAVDLAKRMLGKPCDLIGEVLADDMRYWKWANQVRIFHRAAEKLKAKSTAGHPVPPSFLFPLLEASGMVDDEFLQELFAELVARANSDDSVRQPLILDTLKRLSPEDSLALKGIRDDVEQRDENWSDCGDRAAVPLGSIPRLMALGLIELRQKPAEEFGEENELLSGADDLRGPVEIDPEREVEVITRFGRQFLEAVGLPVTVPDPEWFDELGIARFS
jgi:hypothetical protein